ncbi:hypothetical protein SLS62_010268 [Diatrype stigma]|uniref:Amidase domain-containing protein n=1 Tax=Diatrype stigma TaxID=117547 RepID=A0AAN9UDF9_9PEZI
MRFGVKDVIDVAGLETGCGSKCYRSFYPPRDATAPCIRRLVSAGAVMVGKTRCCQWGDGQDPLERFEEVTPTNPRGDAFQKPSGSSSGSAAGIASYAWLDFTVGTDTGGSIRHPAGVHGIYGVRPSLISGRGSFSSGSGSGMVCCSAFFDTPGVFARSAAVAEVATKVMMRLMTGIDRKWPGDRSCEPRPGADHTRRRYRLLYAVEPCSAERTDTPTFFLPQQEQGRGQWQQNATNETTSPAGAGAGAGAGVIMEDFVQKLERHLDCRRREVCIYDLWKETHPPGTPDDLVDATGTLYRNLVYRRLAKDVVQPFEREYRTAAAAGGRTPFLEPTTRARLEYGANRVSAADCERSVVALEAFANWVNSVLLPLPLPTPTGNGGGGSKFTTATDPDDDAMVTPMPILVYPQSWGKPRYRDELAARRRREGEGAGQGESDSESEIFWSGFSPYSISYCSGCPDLTIPLGEVNYWSKITQTEEHLPVAVSLLGPRGMDSELLELVSELEAGRILRPVQCGSRLYS